MHLRPDLRDHSQFNNITTLQLSPELFFLSPNGPQKQQELTEFSFGWSTLASKAFKPNCSRLFRRAWAPACRSFRLKRSNGKKVPYINTHLIIVLVHQLPSLAVCSFGVHEVSNKSRHFLEVDRMMRASVIMVMLVVLVVMLVMLCAHNSLLEIFLCQVGRQVGAVSQPHHDVHLVGDRVNFSCCSSLLIWRLRWWCWSCWRDDDGPHQALELFRLLLLLSQGLLCGSCHSFSCNLS